MTLRLSMLGKILFCSQPLAECKKKGTELHRCLCKPSLIHTMATASSLWSCWGNQQHELPPHHDVPAPHWVRKKMKSLILACQQYCVEQCSCKRLPLVFGFSHVGCIDLESSGNEIMSSVTSGRGLCRRCYEGICFLQIMFSHLVPSLEALDSSALDY